MDGTDPSSDPRGGLQIQSWTMLELQDADRVDRCGHLPSVEGPGGVIEGVSHRRPDADERIDELAMQCRHTYSWNLGKHLTVARPEAVGMSRGEVEALDNAGSADAGRSCRSSY